MPDESEEPLMIDEAAPAPRLRESACRSRRSGDATALWLIVALIAVTAGVYAIYLGNQPPPLAPQDTPRQIAAEPEQAPRPLPQPVRRPKEITRVIVKEPEPQPVVERVVEEPSAKVADLKTDDPAKEFDSENAFDNPTHRDSRGRPGLSTFNNPTHGPVSSFENPPHGPVSGMAPRSERPNEPDPSFREPVPRKGRR